jgi:hypothetical protein
MVFESVIMQVTSDASIYVELIKEIGITVGVIGGIIASVAAIAKNRTTSKEVHQVADNAIKIGQYATAFGQKTVEQEERMKTIAEAVIELSPNDLKKFLAENKVTAQEYTHTVKAARQQLEILDAEIPKEAKANNIKDLPR